MAAHKKSLTLAPLTALTAVLMAVLMAVVVSGFSRTQTVRPTQTVRLNQTVRLKADTTGPQRIISLIPSVTEMLFAMGAGPRVVGVGNYDRFPPEALTKTKVGGLIDPDIERILSLKPDLVAVYSTQADLRTQMDRARIPTFLYQHAGLPDITDTIRTLGTRIGSGRSAAELADRIDASIADTRKRVAGKPRPRTLLVFGRDAETLRGIYASGGIGFLNDMLDAAGGTNVFADLKRQSAQATSELILTRAPDAIVEVGADTASSKGRNVKAWDALGSVPAVRTHRIYLLRGDDMMNPGPRVAQAVRRIAEVLHPEAFK